MKHYENVHCPKCGEAQWELVPGYPVLYCGKCGLQMTDGILRALQESVHKSEGSEKWLTEYNKSITLSKKK